MVRCLIPVAFGSILATVMPTLAATVVTRFNDHAELNQKWCESSPERNYIFILPASLFVDSQQLFCNGVPYNLYRVIDPYESYDLNTLLSHRSGRRACSAAAARPAARWSWLP